MPSRLRLCAASIAASAGSWLGIASAFAVSAVAFAQNPPIHFDPRVLESDYSRVPVAAETRVLVEGLASESFADREQATAKLLARRVPLAEMLGVLSAEGLTEEQRHRLVGVVSQQVERIPRGALGIRMDTGREVGSGVVVSGFVDGMPASHVLEIGDRIIEIEGAPTPTSSELIGAVQRRLPGEVVRLRLFRTENGVERERSVDLVLGSVEQLQQDDTDPFVRQNPVLAERARFIAELQQRFGAPSVLATVAALPEPASGEHPEVMRLRLYFDLLDSGVVTDREALRSVLGRRLVRMRQDAAEFRRDAAERQALRELADRCEAMLRERD